MTEIGLERMSWRSLSAGSIAGVEFALVWKLLLKACTISETLGLEDKETMLVETGLLQDVDKYVSCDDESQVGQSQGSLFQ